MAILEFLYASTAFIGLASFVPQFVKLLKDTSGAESISISAVSLWTLVSLISLLYAIQINGDWLFIFGTGVFTFGNGTILLLAVYNRSLKRVRSKI